MKNNDKKWKKNGKIMTKNGKMMTKNGLVIFVNFFQLFVIIFPFFVIIFHFFVRFLLFIFHPFVIICHPFVNVFYQFVKYGICFFSCTVTDTYKTHTVLSLNRTQLNLCHAQIVFRSSKFECRNKSMKSSLFAIIFSNSRSIYSKYLLKHQERNIKRNGTEQINWIQKQNQTQKHHRTPDTFMCNEITELW